MGEQSGWFPWWRVQRACAWGHAVVSRRVRKARRSARLAEEHNRDMELIMVAILRRNSNCVDVGAHGGSMLRRMLRVAPDGRHIAVEPIPELAQRLRAQFPEVTVLEAALSDRAGTAQFTVAVDDPALSGLGRTDLAARMRTRSIEVRTLRLDEIVPADLPVHLLKIDVERGELAVLQGAVDTLKRWQPHVLFEHGGRGNDAIYDLLARCGLTLFTVDGRGPLDRPTFGHLPGVWDYLAKPW